MFVFEVLQPESRIAASQVAISAIRELHEESGMESSHRIRLS